MRCKACSHRSRVEIDREIVYGRPLRPLAASTGLSLGVLHRHKSHIREALQEAMRSNESERSGQAGDLLQRVHRLADEAIGILETAKATGNLKAATAAICASVRTLELIGRLDGSLAQPNAPGIHLNLTSNRTTIKYSPGDDRELAELIAEATDNFNPAELLRLQRLVENASSKALADSSSVHRAFNDLPIVLNPKP
jgi:hypothetical protein